MITCHVRIILESGQHLHNLEDIVSLLNYRNRKLAHVASVIQNSDSVIDIQFSAEDVGYGDILRVWHIFGLKSGGYEHNTVEEYIASLTDYELHEPLLAESYIASIWVRETGGSIGDKLYAFLRDDTELKSDRQTLYSFDSVQIKWMTTPDEVLSGWDTYNADDFVWHSNLKGTYASHNYRDEQTSTRNPSWSVGCGDVSDYLENFFFEYYRMPDYLTDIEINIWKNAKKVDFIWKDRIVRQFRRCTTLDGNDGWSEYNFNDWDNCVNPEWLAYKQEIGLEE